MWCWLYLMSSHPPLLCSVITSGIGCHAACRGKPYFSESPAFLLLLHANTELTAAVRNIAGHKVWSGKYRVQAFFRSAPNYNFKQHDRLNNTGPIVQGCKSAQDLFACPLWLKQHQSCRRSRTSCNSQVVNLSSFFRESTVESDSSPNTQSTLREPRC